MLQLVYVRKVHTHVLGEGGYQNAMVVTHLIPVLDSSAPIETKAKALCAIYHASQHNHIKRHHLDPRPQNGPNTWNLVHTLVFPKHNLSRHILCILGRSLRSGVVF